MLNSNERKKIIISETPELCVVLCFPWVIADFFASFFFPPSSPLSDFDYMVEKKNAEQRVPANSCQEIWLEEGNAQQQSEKWMWREEKKSEQAKTRGDMKTVWLNENIHKFARNRRDVVVLLTRRVFISEHKHNEDRLELIFRMFFILASTTSWDSASRKTWLNLTVLVECVAEMIFVSKCDDSWPASSTGICKCDSQTNCGKNVKPFTVNFFGAKPLISRLKQLKSMLLRRTSAVASELQSNKGQR